MAKEPHNSASEFQIIGEVRTADTQHKLLFQLGKGKHGLIILLKPRGIPYLYCIPISELEDMFGK